MEEETGLTKEALASLIRISEGINNQAGQVFVGNQTFTASNISFAPKRKRSDDDFKHFNLHYEVPNNVSTHFTGRLDILEDMNRNILSFEDGNGPSKSQRRFVLYGLGGSGKTQIALKFAEENREKFWGIFWVDATTDSTAEWSLVGIAKTARLEDQSPGAAKKWLTNLARPWLLIFDNADDPSMHLSKHFPAGNRGAILITTRNPDTRHLATRWREVNVMPEEEAIELLLKGISNILPSSSSSSSSGRNKTTSNPAKEVVRTLGYIPLAIAQAAGTIRQGICGLEKYCEVFSEKRKYLMEHRAGDDSSNYEYTAYASWEISANYLEAKGDEIAVYALNILNLLSCIHCVGLSEKMFKAVWLINHGVNPGGDHHEADLHGLLFKRWPYLDPPTMPMSCFREAVSLLSSFSLIQADISEQDCIISMHPTVHFWVKDRLSVDTQGKWQIMATIFLEAATGTLRPSRNRLITEYMDNFATISTRRSLIPHIDTLLSRVSIAMICSWGRGLDVVNSFSSIFREGEEFGKCLDIISPAIDFYVEKMGTAHLHTVLLVRLMALTYLQMGRSNEGMQILEDLTTLVNDPQFVCSQDREYSHRRDEILQNILLAISRETVYEMTQTSDGEIPGHAAAYNFLAKAFNFANKSISAFAKEAARTKAPGLFPILFSLKRHLAELYMLTGENMKAFGILNEAAAELKEHCLPSREVLKVGVSSQLRLRVLLSIAAWNHGLLQIGFELMSETVDSCKEELGPDHALTLRRMKCLELMEGFKAIPRELWFERSFV
ncbi:hypothetical protein TWF281_009388 [Arthrobotrys megalospora]